MHGSSEERRKPSSRARRGARLLKIQHLTIEEWARHATYSLGCAQVFVLDYGCGRGSGHGQGHGLPPPPPASARIAADRTSGSFESMRRLIASTDRSPVDASARMMARCVSRSVSRRMAESSAGTA